MPRPTCIVAAGFPMHSILRGIERSVMVFAAGGQQCSPVGQAPTGPEAATPLHQMAEPPSESRPYPRTVIAAAANPEPAPLDPVPQAPSPVISWTRSRGPWR